MTIPVWILIAGCVLIMIGLAAIGILWWILHQLRDNVDARLTEANGTVYVNLPKREGEEDLPAPRPSNPDIEECEDAEECEDGGWDDYHEEGCLFPGECCMPGAHYTSECHTQDMLEAEEAFALGLRISRKRLLLARNLLNLAKHHKKTCEDTDCNVSLFLLGETYESVLDRKMKAKELRHFL